jgi:hypothetical protein
MKQFSPNNSFGVTQNEALQAGRIQRSRFVKTISRLTNSKSNEKLPHTYIFSPPGLGKTYTCQEHFKSTGTKFVQISGNISMFMFGIQLAVIDSANTKKENIIIYVDDCDVIFANEPNCNTMKNVLDGIKEFVYEKSLASQFSQLGEIQKQAILDHQSEDRSGFSVDCSNMTFVFTSNFMLPDDDIVRLARERNNSKSALLTHKNAIGSRCKVADFDLTPAEYWGWIADVVLNTDCIDYYGMSQDQKVILLTFYWEHWERLKQRSLRAIDRMAKIIIDEPDTYKLIWELEYLKREKSWM